MTNSVNLTLDRELIQNGEYSFSTNHDPDVVEKWLKTTDVDMWEGVDVEWNDDYEECPKVTYVSVDEGDGDDEDCDYDDQIQSWIDENTVDMNQIFSSGCEIQKITDFIKKNEKLFNTLTKKELVEELTEDEKKVFYELREIAGMFIPFEYRKES